MPNLPNLTLDDVLSVIPSASNVEPVDHGGQKVVFRADVEGTSYAVKFALVPPEIESDELSHCDVVARAAREVATVQECASPFLVKPGPIGLEFVTLHEQKLLYFSEEFITGESLKKVLERQPLAVDEAVRLGVQIASAIEGIWALGRIHRDIKPGNIMLRGESRDFVLLDAGLAFDVQGESLSAGFLVGTAPYFSPEQCVYSDRRKLDFRSDMFSLGATVYESMTGQHPFWTRGEPLQTLLGKIRTLSPPPPSSITPAVPAALDQVVLRMLGKSPHLRYRTCQQLISALREVV